MKILVYTRNFLPDLGGLERNTFTLASALAGMGHEAAVLTETLESDAGEPFAFPVFRSRSRRVFWEKIRWADLVFVNGGLSMNICGLCLLGRRPFVPVYQMASVFLRDGNAVFSKKTRRAMASRAAMSATVSHYAKGVLEGLLPGHEVAALPNPIDVELEKAASEASSSFQKKEFDLLFAGRIIEGKGVFDLVEAVASLRPGLDLTVAFAGEGPDKEEVVRRARAVHLNFTDLGRLDRAELIGAYFKTRALVVPSSTHTEGNPLVIAEALSMGVPVVASDQPAMVEGIGAAGLTFRRGDAGDLAEKLRMLFSNGILEEKTRRTAERKAEFSSEKYRERLAGILEKMSGGRSQKTTTH